VLLVPVVLEFRAPEPNAVLDAIAPAPLPTVKPDRVASVVEEIAPVTANAPEFTAASVEVPDADSEVNAPVDGVEASTVPLIFIEAVPVKFVTTPLLGVPRAGVTSVGLVFKTLLPVPVLATLTTFLLASSASAVEAVSPAKLVTPDVVSVVNAPVDGVDAPTVVALMAALSIVPPLMSAVAATRLATVSALIWSTASTTFVPSQRSTMDLPLGTEIPVPAEVLSVSAKPPVVAFLMKYSLDAVGHTTLRAAVRVPVTFRNIWRDWSEAPLLLVSV
jgi:hypothetical protein